MKHQLTCWTDLVLTIHCGSPRLNSMTFAGYPIADCLAKVQSFEDQLKASQFHALLEFPMVLTGPCVFLFLIGVRCKNKRR